MTEIGKGTENIAQFHYSMQHVQQHQVLMPRAFSGTDQYLVAKDP